MEQHNHRSVPPAVLISGVLGVLVVAVGALALVASRGSASDGVDAEAASAGTPAAARAVSAPAGTGTDEAARAGAAPIGQVAPQHADTPIESMAPLYMPAVVRVEAGDGRSSAGFFVGAGQVATSRSTLFGAAEGRIIYDNGKSFAIQRVIVDAPSADMAIVSVDLPSELLRGLQPAPLEPLPGEKLLLIGPAREPGADDPAHPTAVVGVERVRVGEDLVHFELDGELPPWALGAPALDINGKLAGAVTAPGEGGPQIVGAELVTRNEPLPGLTLERWSAGESVASTRPPPEDPEDWARIRAMPRPEGFGPAPERFGEFTLRPAQVERGGGGVVLDERFTVTGAGTRQDPYVLPWELLASANKTFNPSRGRLVLPERVTMFDGSWVVLEGNLAIPFAERYVSELLMMRHPWDGCCLGVPPTPYDAIEVSLAAPLSSRPQFGRVLGKLRVEPFVRGQWLYGLYVMEDALLTSGDDKEED